MKNRNKKRTKTTARDPGPVREESSKQRSTSMEKEKDAREAAVFAEAEYQKHIASFIEMPNPALGIRELLSQRADRRAEQQARRTSEAITHKKQEPVEPLNEKEYIVNLKEDGESEIAYVGPDFVPSLSTGNQSLWW